MSRPMDNKYIPIEGDAVYLKAFEKETVPDAECH